jgi:hypothetical protein
MALPVADAEPEQNQKSWEANLQLEYQAGILAPHERKENEN